MLRRLIASVFASLVLSGIVFAVLVLPAGAACMTWQDGIKSAAKHARDKDDRVAGVLLTEAETAAVWPLLNAQTPLVPVRLGFVLLRSAPGAVVVFSFDANGCIQGVGHGPSGPVLDAMTTAGVQSEFTIVEPAPA